MLTMLVLSKIDPDLLTSIPWQSPVLETARDKMKEFLQTQERNPLSPEVVKEYLLFLDGNQVEGYCYIEGETDVKKAMVTYQVSSQLSEDQMTELIEKTTSYAFEEQDMLDIHWPNLHQPRPFLLAAQNQGYDCCTDEDVIIYSRDYQDTLDFNHRM